MKGEVWALRICVCDKLYNVMFVIALNRKASGNAGLLVFGLRMGGGE